MELSAPRMRLLKERKVSIGYFSYKDHCLAISSAKFAVSFKLVQVRNSVMQCVQRPYISAGSLHVSLNWKEIGSTTAEAVSAPAWSQTQDQGAKWVEQRIRIDQPYRNFEVMRSQSINPYGVVCF